jgi:hypothetical protein
MEMGRSFDPSDVETTNPKVQSKGVAGEKYAQFIKPNVGEQLIDSSYLDKIVKNIEKFKITLQGYKGYEFNRSTFEESLKKREISLIKNYMN